MGSGWRLGEKSQLPTAHGQTTQGERIPDTPWVGEESGGFLLQAARMHQMLKTGVNAKFSNYWPAKQQLLYSSRDVGQGQRDLVHLIPILDKSQIPSRYLVTK